MKSNEIKEIFKQSKDNFSNNWKGDSELWNKINDSGSKRTLYKNSNLLTYSSIAVFMLLIIVSVTTLNIKDSNNVQTILAKNESIESIPIDEIIDEYGTSLSDITIDQDDYLLSLNETCSQNCEESGDDLDNFLASIDML